MFSVTIPRLLAFCVWPFREYWLFCVWPCREYCHTSAILVTCWTNPVVYTLTVGTIPDPIVTRYSYFLQLKDKTKIFLVVLGKTTITFSMIITHWITASPNVQCMLHLSVIDFLQLHILCITWLPRPASIESGPVFNGGLWLGQVALPYLVGCVFDWCYCTWWAVSEVVR